MAESQALQVANSFLDDVQQQIDVFDRMDKQHEREKFAKQLLTGDLSRAQTKIDEAMARGEDVTYERSRAFFCEGLINLAVAESPEIESTFTAVIVNKQMRNAYLKKFLRKWAEPSIVAFEKSAQLLPTFQATHYNMGRAYLLLENKPAATQAFTVAQQGDDQEVSMEAAKAIARMNEKKGPCFVATACYGDFDHPDVLVFRRWRDDTLLPSCFGRAVVLFYYRFSPPVAARIAKIPRLANAIRRYILAPLASKIK